MGSRSLSRFRFLRLHQLLLFVFVASIVFVYGDTLLLHIQAKVAIYGSNNEKPFLQDVVILSLLFLASIRYAYSKINVVVVFLPLLPILFVLGSDRVNMIGYLLFVYFTFRHNRGLNAAVLATSAYLFWKGGYYLYWLFETGNGFGY